MIEGGTSVNTVPERCQAQVDRRVLPGEEPRALPGQFLAYLQQHVGAARLLAFARTHAFAFDKLPARASTGSTRHRIQICRFW